MGKAFVSFITFNLWDRTVGLVTEFLREFALDHVL